MKIFKNKLFFIIFIIIAFIIGSQVYVVYSNTIRDTHSYATLIRGSAYIDEQLLQVDTRYQLAENSSIRTLDDTLLVIEWGDGSITRLGSNSELLVQKAYISQDLHTVQVHFSLLRGKTWSNVISFLGKDSSFTQSFEGIDAGVRGTIFSVNLEKSYLHVDTHMVQLLDSAGNIYHITPEFAFHLKNLSFIDIDIFIKNIEDTLWAEINAQLDQEFLQSLRSDIQLYSQEYNPFLRLMHFFLPHYRLLYELDTAQDFKTIEVYISNLKEKHIQKSYDLVYTKYQKMNFIDEENRELYTRRLYYKQALILLSQDKEQTQLLLESSMFDIEKLISINASGELGELLDTLGKYTPNYPQLNTMSLERFLQTIPQGLQEEFQANFSQLESVLNIDISSLRSLSPQDILDGASQGIENTLDDAFGDTIRNLLR